MKGLLPQLANAYALSVRESQLIFLDSGEMWDLLRSGRLQRVPLAKRIAGAKIASRLLAGFEYR
jgi:hypothetical protein